MIPSLNNLIHPNYSKNKSNGVYILEETAEKTFPKTKVKTTGQSLLYKFDRTGLLPFFQDVAGAKSMTDYVFFVLHKDVIYIFMTELSTTKIKTYQWHPTKCFVEYIEKTVKRLYPHSHVFKYRYVIVAKNLPRKKPTKPSASAHQNENIKIILPAGETINISHHCIE